MYMYIYLYGLPLHVIVRGMGPKKNHQVVLTLCSLLFNQPTVSWNEPTEHLELFAGVCSISRGEWQVGVGNLSNKRLRNIVFGNTQFGKD